MRVSSTRFRLATCVALASVFGCGNPSNPHSNLLLLDLDREEPLPYITYYFGSFLGPDGGDPFEAGVVVEVAGQYFLDPSVFQSKFEQADLLEDVDVDGTIDWDELSPFLRRTYYDARKTPKRIEEMRARLEGQETFEVSIDGVMTTATRRIQIADKDLRAAILGYQEAQASIIYPVGTVFIADHQTGDQLFETTTMAKRVDGGWDFAVYDATGSRIDATITEPKSLAVPTQCIGCHLGKRLYEPEKSFPAKARPGPSGLRRVHWEKQMPDADLVRYFDEHRKRSDGILGPYATLYTSLILERRAQGGLTQKDRDVLKSLGL